MASVDKKPKVTVEVTPLFDDQWTGIPVFTRRLIRALENHGGIAVDFAVDMHKVPRAYVMNVLRFATGGYLRDDLARLAAHEHELIDHRAHLLFPSVKSGEPIASCEASTVHDLSTLVMPECHEEVNIAFHLDNFQRELATDDVVFCVSGATRAALVSAFPSVRSKIRTLYQYVDWPADFEVVERNLPALALGRYAVVVGTVEPRKNLTLLIDALSEPALASSELKFVIIGRKGWKVDAFLEGLTPEQRDKLVFSGFVSEFVKYRLIKGAEFMVYPSIYEGFGIPALEAMSLGKPVLAARTSSFPEVVGDAGIYFDPLSPSDFAAAFAEMCDPRRCAELAPKALAHNAEFHWQRMAAPVVDWITA